MSQEAKPAPPDGTHVSFKERRVSQDRETQEGPDPPAGSTCPGLLETRGE